MKWKMGIYKKKSGGLEPEKLKERMLDNSLQQIASFIAFCYIIFKNNVRKKHPSVLFTFNLHTIRGLTLLLPLLCFIFVILNLTPLNCIYLRSLPFFLISISTFQFHHLIVLVFYNRLVGIGRKVQKYRKHQKPTIIESHEKFSRLLPFSWLLVFCC